MKRTPTRVGLAVLVGVALPVAAAGHQFGYHGSVDLVVRRDGMTALVTMDAPRGRESLLLRMQADRNGDHQLDADERQTLKANLVRLATRMLDVRQDGKVLVPQVREAKVQVDQSSAVDETPVSIAAIVEYPSGDGVVEVRDEAPDAQPVPVRISFEPSLQAPVEGVAARTVPLRAKPPW